MSEPFAYDLSHATATERALLTLEGPDTIRFLQGTLSNEVGALEPGRAVVAALLTVKAKLICDVVAFARGETVVLSVPAAVADAVYENLDRHIIMDDVTVGRVADRQVLAVGLDAQQVAHAGVDALATQHPAPGTLLVGADGPMAALLATLGLPSGDAETYAAHRVATMSPSWGQELTPDRMPPEVGFDHAVSYAKGCFRGQEPLSRVHNRGQVKRVLARVTVEGLSEGAALAHADRAEAGKLTTCAGDEGLAVLWRALATPGTVFTSTGGTVTVTEPPAHP